MSGPVRRSVVALLGPLLAAAAAAAACDDPRRAGGVEDRARPVTLTVAVASSVAPAFERIAARFEAEAGTRVLVTLGSSGQLAEQIRQGAPVDLFVAADGRFVDELAEDGLILSGTEAVYGRGRLALWSPAGGPLAIERIEDLTRADVRRIALANPEHAPYGRAAREALQSAGIWDELRPKLVLGESVQQAFQYAETGNVDVALVALSLAGRAEGRWVLVPEALHRPLDQTLAAVAGTLHEREALRLADLILGPEGRSILNEHGIVPADEGLP